MVDWQKDDAKTRQSMRRWGYWLLYRTGLYIVEWRGGAFRDRWRWQHA